MSNNALERRTVGSCSKHSRMGKTVSGMLLSLVAAVGVLLTVPLVALDVPFLTARVNDLAGIIDSNAEARIEGRLSSFEAASGSQIAVLTIPSLEGEPLEDYSVRVAETWALGRQGVDDGVLFLIARDDRKMRFEVGYGLEASIPDALAGRILDQVVRPAFRAGDFEGGVEAGVEAVISAIEGGDPLPEPSVGVDNFNRIAGGCGALFMGFIFLSIFGSVVVQMASMKGPAGWIAPLFHGGVASVLVGSIAGGTIGFSLFAALAVILIIFRLFISKTPVGKKLAKWARSRRSRSWSSGTGGYSGGGFSGGGFSGGGGSFGGGGSSSSW